MDGGGADVSISTAQSGVGRAMDLPVGVFRDKGIKEAIPIYLEAARRKQTNKEIAAGLMKGGIATTSDNFEATVGTALLRLKREGIVLRFSDGWDLAALYPDSLRNRLEKELKPTRRAGRRAAARGSRSVERRIARDRRQLRGALRTSAPRPNKSGMEHRITGYLQTRGSEFTTVEELGSQLKIVNLQVIRLVLGKMLKRQKIDRDQEDVWRLLKRVDKTLLCNTSKLSPPWV